MTQKTILTGIVGLLVIALGIYYFSFHKAPQAPVTSFEECIAAGGTVMESYPRQCTAKDGTHFTENIGNELDKSNVIQITSPRPNAEVSSPLTISGQAKGSWFFEGSFPVSLTDGNGNTLAQGVATAKGEWMTEDFVPFEATLTFSAPTSAENGTLILKKDNPSGLPANDDSLQVPVVFASSTTPPPTGFAPYHSGIHGLVVAGPVCPIMKNPGDPECADKPYQTTVSISRASSVRQVFATADTDASGTFQISLPPGDYVVTVQDASKLPRCPQASTTVAPTEYSNVTIRCDTGIR